MPYATSKSNNAAPHRKNAVQRNNRSDSLYQQRTAQKDNPTQLLIKPAVGYLILQFEARTQRNPRQLSRSDGPVPQLQLREHSANRTSESSDIVLHLAGVNKYAGLRAAGFARWKACGSSRQFDRPRGS